MCARTNPTAGRSRTGRYGACPGTVQARQLPAGYSRSRRHQQDLKAAADDDTGTTLSTSNVNMEYVCPHIYIWTLGEEESEPTLIDLARARIAWCAFNSRRFESVRHIQQS